MEGKGSGNVKSGCHQFRGSCKREDVFAATPPLAAMRFILTRAASCGYGHGHGRCFGFVGCVCHSFMLQVQEAVFVGPPNNMMKDTTIWKLCHVRHAGCRSTLAKTGA